MPESRRDAQADDTRAALIASATILFAEQGYAATGTEEIVRRARCTRGALYHHFRNKSDLFRAVLEDVERTLIEGLAAEGALGADNWERFRNGCGLFLDASLEPTVQRIMLVDGPAVLGWQAWRDVERRYGFGLVGTWLTRVMNDGLIDEQPVDALTHLIAGAMNEAAMSIAHAPDPAARRAEMGATLDRLLDGLRPRG
ncbi:MAG: TetR/AcrR family transcriptional regulator [Acidimicrobiia bacterium]